MNPCLSNRTKDKKIWTESGILGRFARLKNNSCEVEIVKALSSRSVLPIFPVTFCIKNIKFIESNWNVQIQIFFKISKAIRQFVWLFTHFVRFTNKKLFLFWFAELPEQFQVHNSYKTRESTVLLLWKFWRKYGSVSCLFTCMIVEWQNTTKSLSNISQHFSGIAKIYKKLKFQNGFLSYTCKIEPPIQLILQQFFLYLGLPSNSHFGNKISCIFL